MKEDNQRSEQTFGVGITITDPSSISAAALQTKTSGDDWDFRVGTAGQTFIQVDFPFNLQSVAVTFVLNADIDPEGIEGFKLRSNVVAFGYPSFLPPLGASTTAYQVTTVRILDNDCKSRLNWGNSPSLPSKLKALHPLEDYHTVGVKLKFPFRFRKPKWYTVLTKKKLISIL